MERDGNGSGTAPLWEGEPAVRYTPWQQETLARLRTAVEGRLRGHRLEHVFNVERAALQLACAYGVDPFEARAAGLLHDWDKQLPREELWRVFDERCAWRAPWRDARMEPLLHAWTAAATLPERFPELSPAVFQAIERHTVGAPDMAPLDMVVYVADMLEPTRRGCAFDALRAQAGAVCLEKLFVACLQRSMAYLIESGRYVYPGGVEVWNAYC